MEEEKRELDTYAIPAVTRPKYFAFKVFGGWGAAGIMFVILLRCFNARSSDQKENATTTRQIEIEARKQARSELKEDFEYFRRENDEFKKQLDRAFIIIDSLKARS